MKKSENSLAEKFLQVSAIKLQPEIPFVWGSGWNAPIYNDHRRILSYPQLRNLVKIELAKEIIERFPDAQVIAGASTSAIAIGALTADVIGMPFVYVRETPKDHGLENMIEGNLRPGQKVVILEDLVTTATNSVRAKDAIEMNGCEALGLVAIFSYEFPMAVKRLNDDDLQMTSLIKYSDMLNAAVELDYIRPDDLATLQEWRKDPANWAPNVME